MADYYGALTKNGYVDSNGLVYEDASMSILTGCSTLKSGVIDLSTYADPEFQLKQVKDYAFENCTNLTAVILPNTLMYHYYIDYDHISNHSFENVNMLIYHGSDYYQYNTYGAKKRYRDGYLMDGDNNFLYSDYIVEVDGVDVSVYSIDDSSILNIDGKECIIDGNNVKIIRDYQHSPHKDYAYIRYGTILLYIGNDASISIPDCVYKIESNVFADASLTYVGVDNENSNLREICQNAFKNCSLLTSITIPNGVKNIERDAFYGCTGITDVYFNAIDCKTVGNGGETHNSPFTQCISIENVVIGDNVTNIPDYAFYGLSNLTSIEIPDSVTSIGERVFTLCESLTDVSIGTGVTNIESFAFYRCKSLENMTIPFIGGSANATEASESTLFGYIFGVINNHQIDDYNFYENVTQYCSINEYHESSIPKSLRNVNVIGGDVLFGSFYNCNMITSVTLGNDVEKIDYLSFYNCSSLEEIIIDASSLVIKNDDRDYSVWAGCNNFQRVSIENLADIPNYMFAFCNSLTDLYDNNFIHGNIASIGNYAFYECTSLRRIDIGSPFIINREAFKGCTSLRYINSNNNVKLISDGFDNDVKICEEAFSGCTSIVSLQFYKNNAALKDFIVDYNAFYGCTSLKESAYSSDVLVIENAKQIEESAFNGCTSIINVRLKCKNVVRNYNNQNYADGPFKLCTNLANVHIDDVVEYIPSNMFWESSNYHIANVYLGSNPSLKSVGVGAFSADNPNIADTSNGVVYLKDAADGNKNKIVLKIDTNLSTFTSFDANAKWIAEYAFSDSNLTSITIPSTINFIDAYAFARSHSLQSVTIDGDKEYIGVSIFNSCENLQSINIQNTTQSSKYDSSLNGVYNNIIFCKDGSALIAGCIGSILPSTNGYVKKIDSGAFYGTGFSGDSNQHLNLYCEEICDGAFGVCSSINAVYFDVSVNSINYSAFEGCRSLVDTSVNANNEIYTSIDSNSNQLKCIIEKDTSTLILGTINGDIDVNVKSIADYAFNSRSVQRLDCSVSTNLERIGDYAFYDCSVLDTVVFSDAHDASIYIGIGAFSGSAVSSINLIDKVVGVGSEAFYDCDNLHDVSIGNGIKTLTDINTFGSCNALQNVDIGENIEMISSEAFRSVSTIENFIIRSAVPPRFSYYNIYLHPDFSRTYLYVVDPELYDSFINPNSNMKWNDPSLFGNRIYNISDIS